MEQQTTQVLVVDDNPEIRDIIHVLLEGEDIRVTEAADGSSALHFLEKGSFDLIILDIMMPGLNGYETCQKIRQLTNVPILFLSAKTLFLYGTSRTHQSADSPLPDLSGKIPDCRTVSIQSVDLRRSVPGSPVGKGDAASTSGGSHFHRVSDPEAAAFQPQTDFLSSAPL